MSRQVSLGVASDILPRCKALADRDWEREKERKADMEVVLNANCHLLGLDPNVLGLGAGMRVGLFRHSNPHVGEALLYFLMCALRGPSLSVKVISYCVCPLTFLLSYQQRVSFLYFCLFMT